MPRARCCRGMELLPGRVLGIFHPGNSIRRLYSVTVIEASEEIKSRQKSVNACYHAVQNFLSFSLISKSLKTKIYRTIILPVVLYGCETWSLTLREE